MVAMPVGSLKTGIDDDVQGYTSINLDLPVLSSLVGTSPWAQWVLRDPANTPGGLSASEAIKFTLC